MTNEQIINQFTNSYNRKDTNTRKALSIRGGKLYSYNLLIGEYVVEEGFQGLLIHDHWGKGLGTVSNTTSQHVGLLIRATQYLSLIHI